MSAVDAVTSEQLHEVPELLKSIPNWVEWKLVDDSKVPFVSGTQRHASSTDSSTWTTFDAVKNSAISSTQGVGFVIHGAATDHKIVGFDLDGAYDSETDTVAPWAVRVIDALSSYTEYTPSNSGLRVWVRGKLPAGDRVFNLNPASGFGLKVKIEVFDHARYFTVTGNGYFEDATIIETRDLTAVYKLLHEIRSQYPVAKSEATSTPASGASSVEIKQAGTVITTKLAILMSGTIKSQTPFVIEDERGASLEFPSQSEADLSLATCLALEHGDDAALIASEFSKSPLAARDKWKRDDYRTGTISRAIKTAAKITAEAEAPRATKSVYAMTPEEIEAEHGKDFPVFTLVERAGPTWSDDVLYGLAGQIVKRASEYSEAHPSGMYLDLLISLGSIFGRNVHFSFGATKHFTNEFLARVGATSDSRKGTGRDTIDAITKLLDPAWFKDRVMSGFGSAESIVHHLRDPFEQQVKNNKAAGPEFRTITVPGITDKRLCVREGELASIFQLASKGESRADIVFRDGWDGKTIQNLVKGKGADGVSLSAQCLEPHLSISGDTTISELKRKMPPGSDQNGFGNRFLYCFVYRTKKCPLGGPEIDWAPEIIRLFDVVKFAREQKRVPLSKAAENVWTRMYLQLDEEKLSGVAGSMTARAAAHIRRLALILTLTDLSPVTETKHLKAARRLWDYCQESAKFIFSGSTNELDSIVDFVRRGPTTLTKISEGHFKWNKKADWVRTQVDALVASKRLSRDGENVAAVTG
jgi:Protein of unknown function (DUF3987)